MLISGYSLTSSRAFPAAFPDEQPVTSWWQIIEKNEDGSQKYRLFTKEIGRTHRR